MRDHCCSGDLRPRIGHALGTNGQPRYVYSLRDGFTSHYGGLIASDFSPQSWCRHGVTRGQILGYIGAHPNAPLGPLCFALYRGRTTNGAYSCRPVSPMKVLPCWSHLALDTLPLQRAA